MDISNSYKGSAFNNISRSAAYVLPPEFKIFLISPRLNRHGIHHISKKKEKNNNNKK